MFSGFISFLAKKLFIFMYCFASDGVETFFCDYRHRYQDKRLVKRSKIWLTLRQSETQCQ